MRRNALGALLGALIAAVPVGVIAGPIDDLQPGQWYEVPNSHLRPLVPDPTPPGDPACIMKAWSGGTYDTKRCRLLVWGGGHADYGGNEIYAFDVNTLSWSRIWGPSPIDAILAQWDGTCTYTYSDGNPVARHTYDGLTYLPVQDRFWIFGGSLTCGSGGFGIDTWTFDLTGGRWERRADGPFGSPPLVTSAYDPTTGHVFMADESYVITEYDPVANTWVRYGNAGGVGLDKNGEIDPRRRLFVAVGYNSSNGEIRVYDLNQHPPIMQRVMTTGAVEITNARFPGLAYDPASDRIVAWSGGSDVYTLNLDTWVWTRHIATNSVVPTPAASAGTYGRWQYIPSKNAFIGVNSIDEDVYIYKLSASTAPADTIAPSAPANLRPR